MDIITALVAIFVGSLLAQLTMPKTAPPKEAQPTTSADTQMLAAVLEAYVETRRKPSASQSNNFRHS